MTAANTLPTEGYTKSAKRIFHKKRFPAESQKPFLIIYYSLILPSLQKAWRA